MREFFQERIDGRDFHLTVFLEGFDQQFGGDNGRDNPRDAAVFNPKKKFLHHRVVGLYPAEEIDHAGCVQADGGQRGNSLYEEG